MNKETLMANNKHGQKRKSIDEVTHEESFQKKVDRSPDIELGKKQASVFAAEKFIERIPLSTLNKLLNSNLLRVERNNNSWNSSLYNCPEKTHLQKLCRKVENDLLTVSYSKPKSGYGRVQPKKAFSLGVLRKEVRHTLCDGGDWLDFDIVNCHPVLILQICKGQGIASEALQNYCDHRERCLEEVCGVFPDGFTPDNRGKAKTLFIRILYGGSETAWLKDNKLTGTLPTCVTNLKNELKLINRNLQRLNTNLVNAVQKMKPRHFDRSFMSYYAQEWERRILECVYEMMVERKYILNNDCVLCYDGIMIHKQNLGAKGEDDVIKECEAAVYQELGFRLKFETKPMTKSLMPELMELEKQEIECEQPFHDEFDIDYMNSLGSYKLKKRYFYY